MKNIQNGLILVALITVIFSCGKKNIDAPDAIFKEFAKNMVPNTLSSKEKDNDWHLLFDGTTTEGWHGYNMKYFPDCWKIEDSSLTMNSIGGLEEQDIITNRKYRDFVLCLEYKLTKAANSGVIFQVAEDTMYKFPYETGPEFQIIDHLNWPDKLEDWQKNGANYAMYPPVGNKYKPVGDWNQLLLYVKGNSVTQILNGVTVVKYVKKNEEWLKLRNSGKWSNFPDWGKYDEGFISLQNHGTKVWFRNIKIKEI